MASLTDVVTVAQNIVNAIKTLANTNLTGQGNITSATVTAATLITVGNGRLVSVSVTVLGSTEGVIHNCSAVGNATAENALLAVDPTVLGVVPAGQAFNLGLVVIPGTGQSLNVTYYQP